MVKTCPRALFCLHAVAGLAVNDEPTMMVARMPRESSRSALASEVHRFEVALRALALALTRAVLANELERRIAAAPPRSRPQRRRRKPTPRPRERRLEISTTPPINLTSPGNDAEARDVGAASAMKADSLDDAGIQAPADAGTPASSGHAARRWTREAVVHELGAWLLAGQPAEAAFVKRHGPKGLVAAATKFFGRFDAALNTANLAIAGQVDAQRKAERNEAREVLPSLRELARRQQQRRRAAAASLGDPGARPADAGTNITVATAHSHHHQTTVEVPESM